MTEKSVEISRASQDVFVGMVDMSLCLNARVVNPEIAADAAQVFYNDNSFDFDDGNY